MMMMMIFKSRSELALLALSFRVERYHDAPRSGPKFGIPAYIQFFLGSCGVHPL